MQGNSNGAKIRVLVVDDSVLMGIQITKILNADGRLEVVGRAKDGLEALELVEKLKPDVVTLDVEMPRMDGLTALKHIMVRCPVPTVMVSALTWEGTRATFDALRFGAVDVIAKPSRRETESLDAQAQDIVTRVKRAATIGIGRARYRKKAPANPFQVRGVRGVPDAATRIIGIGAGSGGYYSLLQVVPNLRADFEDVVIAVLHVASRFIEPFVAYLGAHSAVPVKNVGEVGVLEKGTCYVCSSQDAAVLTQDMNGRLRFAVRASSHAVHAVAGIDTMFRTIGAVTGRRAVGVLMSGAGNDGAEGLALVRKSGGLAIVQTLTNCMNPSMPKAALMKHPADKVLPDYLIADFLMTLHGAHLRKGAEPRMKAVAGGSS
jgi:two-component system, chemotaxis family, protein-glutamate methylesterase/glutaminase